MPITDEKLKATTESFQKLATDLFEGADDARKEELLNQLFSSLRGFSRAWRAETGFGCPAGWTECPDGSCVPPDAGCGGSLDFAKLGETREDAFKVLNAYIEELASSYFAMLKSDTEAQEKTRSLFQETLQKFVSSVNTEIQS